MDVGAFLLRLLLQLGVLLDSADELFSRSGQGHVLDSQVDSLLDVSVLDLLIDDHSDRGLRNIVDDTSLSVIDCQFCISRSSRNWKRFTRAKND